MKPNIADTQVDALEAILGHSRIIPVITIESAEDAIPLAQALAAGGLPVIEITLRTPDALNAIRRIKDHVENVYVGAGTVLNPLDVENAVKAGADFLISPGSTDALLGAGSQSGLPFLPGVANASDVMRCLDYDLDVLKFFPAEIAGGINAITALHGPFPQVRFCPTGGVGPGNLASYLQSPAVVCVGGTWIAPKDDIRHGKWDLIAQRAAQASLLADEIQNPAS